MFTVAVCDDSKLMLESMKAGLEEYAKEKKEEVRVFLFHNGSELLEGYRAKYDILFLDIKMPGMNGIEVAQKIRQRDKKVIIIFLTSLIEHALDGYSVNAANYIIKPISRKRLYMEMDRWVEEMRQKEEPYINFHNDNGNYKVLLKNINYIETYNRNLLVHTSDGNLVCYWKLKEMENKIGKYGFSRNHASYLINLFYVENIEKMEVKLSTGERLPLSKMKKKEFMEQLAEYWGKSL